MTPFLTPKQIVRAVRHRLKVPVTEELHITHVRLIDYRMPLKRAYGTARSTTRASTNFLILVYARGRGTDYVAVGEAQPRHRLSGDIDIATAWEYSSLVAERLQGRTLSLNDVASTMRDVECLVQEVAEYAHLRAEERNRDKPFRGSQLGFETALLDLAGQVWSKSVAQLLGEKRPSAEVTVSTLSTENSMEELQQKLGRQADRYPMVRVKGHGEPAKDLELLQIVHSVNVEAGDPKPLWVDFNEGLSAREAEEFVRSVAEKIAAQDLPELITLEQPVPHADRQQLPALQATADRLTQENGRGDIRIMPDESLWDVDDLEELHRLGGCRALNIKTAKTGGLLASLRLAERAVELNPDTTLCIGGMVGTSDITTWSLINLAKAFPRMDYLTAAPPGNRAERISHPRTRLQKSSNVHRSSTRQGVGAEVLFDRLAPYIRKEEWFPSAPESVSAGGAGKNDLADAAQPEQLPDTLEESLKLSLRTEAQLQRLIDAEMRPKNWSSSASERRKKVQPILDKVNPFQVSYMGLRRIERRGMHVGRGLSFRTKMMEASEARSLGVHRPTWLLDDKAAAYQFVDTLGVPRPESDGAVHRFAEIEERYPCVVKSTRSTGSRGCYLVYSPDRIVHVYDSAALSSWQDMASHATNLMDPASHGHTLADRWIVEELILDPNSETTPARDMKYLCFYGEVLLVLEMRREGGREYSFTYPDGTPADTGRNLKHFQGDGTTPQELEMVKAISAEIPFPFVRIDMLRGSQGLVFGEFTPRIGYYTDFSDFWDRKMGEAWVLAESRLSEDLLRGKRFDAFLEATSMLQHP